MSRTQNVHLSKQLTWLLRHGAQKEGLAIQPDGFVSVASILNHPRFGAEYSLDILHEIVSSDKKQRFLLRCNPLTDIEEIRANQGHSLAAVESDACMVRIQNASELSEAVVHGTYVRHWASIKAEGLKRMQRNHVHFALLTSNNCAPLSGFRSDCEVLIYLNVEKVLADRLPLFRSSNNVILCAGVDGVIEKKYFLRAIEKRTGRTLSF